MAMKNVFSKRFLGMSRNASYAVTNCRTSSPRMAVKSAVTRHQKPPTKLMLDPGDDGIFRRYLHRKSSPVALHLPFFPTGEKILEKLQVMDVTRDRVRLDGLIPPALPARDEELTAEDAKKIFRLSQLESVKAKVKRNEKETVSYSEFIEICAEGCSDPNQALEFAKMLDESGNVLVLGSTVFLQPEQVLKAMKPLLTRRYPVALDTSSSKELEEMEKMKMAIDADASKLVRCELWLGLGFLVLQTAGFMRLTFWELTWDVMEPICFFVTSMYFMAGYTFFLRTSKEPSFEGFYQSRLETKHKRLIKSRSFDLDRYHRLRGSAIGDVI